MRAYWLWIILCLVFGACGSDDSQKSNDVTSPGETEENKESNSDKKNPKEVDPDEDQDYIKSSLPSNIELSIDTVRDNYRSTNIYYIRVGNAVWNSQKNTATSSPSLRFASENTESSDSLRCFICSSNQLILFSLLALDQFGVEAVLLQKLIVCATLHYVSVLQHNDLIAAPDG